MIRRYRPLFKPNLKADILLTEDESHYICNVMRRSVGDSFSFFNDMDGEWLMTLTHISKKRTEARFDKLIRSPINQQNQLALTIGILKHDAMSLVIEKATELGVTHIWPLITDHCQSSSAWRHDRYAKIAQHATQQCERLDIPFIDAPKTLEQWLYTMPDDFSWCAAIERLDHPKDKLKYKNGIIVGPEGGFSQAEKELFLGHSDISSISLTSTILRAETAAIYGIALIHAQNALPS